MNQLINETSPYLLQHAHNPVNWYPWGEEALQKAVAEDKPILVSIGYAACHWCHVMERESFEDEATAAIMNQYFVNIKIDREERPDLDHIYMDAVQAMTGSGGWPLNVFLTPGKKPFFGGTYFPPVQAFNRSSWKEVLEGVSKGYRERKEEIIAQAENLTGHMLTANAFGIQKPATEEAKSFFSAISLNTIAENILKNADNVWGGFGNAPKFPQTFCIQYLLRQYHFTKSEAALEQALLSIDKMIDGGIYDQLGGGFARYSTDTKWLAPHFEKMLYDNALLIGVIAEAFQLTGNKKYKTTIEHTLAFINREMTSPEHGFYSAIDADSEGVEGKFYTWQKEEIDTILGNDAPVFCEYYGITPHGNWEETNILWVQQPITGFADGKNIDQTELEELLEKGRQKLFLYREHRKRPQLDDKILLGWNAMMNTACSKAFAATGIAAYQEKAIRNMEFLETKFAGKTGNWHHTYSSGLAKIPAFLDDYAYLVQAYIHLQEITGEGDYLFKAKTITEWVITHFAEPESGFFFYTHESQNDVVIRKKEVYDGATPSGNAVMMHNLLYLATVFDLENWRAHGRDLLESLGKAILKYPTSFGVWALGLQNMTHGQVEIALIGQRATQFLPRVLQKFVPNKIIQVGETNSAVFPLLSGKKVSSEEKQVDFYICKDYMCSEPFTKLEEFLANV